LLQNWRKHISTDFNHSENYHQRHLPKIKVCHFCKELGHIQRYCLLNKHATKEANFQIGQHQRQPIYLHPSSRKFLKLRKQKQVMCGQHLPRNEHLYKDQTLLLRPHLIKCQIPNSNKALAANNSRETKVTQLIQSINKNLNKFTYKMHVLTRYLNLKEQWDVIAKAGRQQTKHISEAAEDQSALRRDCHCQRLYSLREEERASKSKPRQDE